MIIKIVVVLIAIVSVAAVVALFTRDKYTLLRSVVIRKSSHDVFEYIRLNRNQKSYSKWLSLDPKTKIEYRGSQDGTPGAILAFSSNDKKAGTGEWETKKVSPDTGIEFELRFLEPFEFTANGEFQTKALNSQETEVTWIYNSGMKWPMNFMLLFMDMDKLVGNDIQISLENLKNVLERQE